MFNCAGTSRTRLTVFALSLLFFVGARAACAQELTYVGLTPGDSGSTVILSDLLTGFVPGVKVGDKVFSQFSYSGNGDMPDSSVVSVFGFQDPDGNYGLSFHGAFIDFPGGEPSQANLGFDVSVATDAQQQGWRISDAHLFMGGVGLGNESEISINESFAGVSQTLNVFSSTVTGQSGQTLSDWVDFDDPTPSLRVTKEIFAFAGQGTNLPARTTVIDQSFSQVQVPEPSAAMLMILASAWLIGRRNATH